MSAEVSCSASSAPFRFRAYHGAPTAGSQTAVVPRDSTADMGAAGAKPLNGETLSPGHTCAVRSAGAGGGGGGPGGGGGGGGDEEAACNCAPCKEKVRLPTGQEKLVSGELEAAGQQQQEELRQLHTDWIELRQSLKQLYWLHMDAPPAGDAPARQAAAPIQAVMKEKVVRLCQRDPHQLFQRLQGQLQELTLEVKVRLLEHLSRERPGLAQLFLTALLDNYDRLVTASVSLAPAVHALEHHHLSRFGLSWESLNKHAYQSVVYMDPMVQNNLPTFISQLRALLSGQEQQLVYADLVRRYLSFDDEMSRAALQWAAAEARLQEFGQEQATLKAKQRMLREDWELLRAQRKLLQQQVLGRDGVTAEEEEEALQRLVAGCTEDGCEECALTLPEPAAGGGEAGRPRTIGLMELRQALETASRSGDGDAPPGGGKPAAVCAAASAAAPAPAGAPHAACHATPPACSAPPPASAPARPTACLKKSASTQAPPPPPLTGCQAQGAGGGCQAGNAAHKHTYSKAAPTTHRPQPRFDPAQDPADDSSLNDSCSEQSSSTASQHCSCCYCEVFGHGVPPVAPVSRNYPEIRDRLRLRLDQRRRDHKSESSERSGGEMSVHDDTRDIGDLLEFIDGGADQKRNDKRAAKRERQRVRRMDTNAAQEEEQEQIRNIQEFQRRNPEVTITVVKTGEGEPAPQPDDAERHLSCQPGVKKKKQQRRLAKLAAAQADAAPDVTAPAPAPAAPVAAAAPAAPTPAPAATAVPATPAPSEANAAPDEDSPKKASPIMEGLARNGLVSVPCAQGAGDARMVTIRRVMEPGGREPKVTITLKGDSPEKDRVLMTLVNGQLRNGGAAPPAGSGEPDAEPPMTKTAKKKQKKAARLQKLREEEEAAERARLEAERAAEEELRRLEQLQQAKSKKKKKKTKGGQNGTANGNGSTAQPSAQKPTPKITQAPAPKLPPPVVLNGRDAEKWRTTKKPAAEPERKPAAPAPRAAPAPAPAVSAAGKRKSEPVAAAVSEPRRPARPPVEPPTQLMQDLALSSSDSEIEDLARAYRIPSGITISRVRGAADQPAAAAAAGRQSPPTSTAAAGDKKAKKKRKKKTAAAAAAEETVPEVTIRKVGVAPGRRARRSVDDDEAVFMPAAGGDITDLVDKEVEAFKRFCLDGPQVSREHRPKVNLNIKDILIKKKPL